MIYQETSPPENLRYHTNREKEDIPPTGKREVNNSKNALLVGDMFKVIYLVTVIFYVFYDKSPSNHDLGGVLFYLFQPP